MLSLLISDTQTSSAADIQIMKRPDGSLWRLGAGGFGTVFKAMLHGVQPVAVKASALFRSPSCLGMQGGGGCSWCQQLLSDPVRPTFFQHQYWPVHELRYLQSALAVSRTALPHCCCRSWAAPPRPAART